MKQIKKFLGVFLALAMVVGTISTMPVMVAKAAPASITINAGSDVEATLSGSVVTLNAKSGKLIESIAATGAGTFASDDDANDTAPNATQSASTIVIASDKKSATLTFTNANVATFLNNAVGNVTIAINVTTTDAPTPEGGGSGATGDPTKTVDSVHFDYVTSELTIYDNAEDESQVVYVAFGKKADHTAEEIAKLKYDAYLIDGSTTLSLASISPKKDSYLYIYTDAYTKVTKLTISKNDAKPKIMFDFSKTLLSEAIYDKNTTGKVELADLEVRDIYGNWDTVANVFGDGNATPNIDKEVVNYYAAYGATLSFRVKGADTTTEIKDGATVTSQKFVGAEIKVKIPKQAAAPKVALDGAKETIKYGKGLEILSGGNWTALNKDGATLDMKKLTAADTSAADKNFGNMTDGIWAIVRTAATDKKPASKVVIVSLTGCLTAADVSTKLALEAPLDADKLVTVKEVKNDNGTTKSIEITNKSTAYDIEYFIAGSADATTPPEGSKWIKVAKATATAPKVVKVDKKFALEGKYVIIRIASIKDATTKINSIPSSPVSIGSCPVWVATTSTTTTTAAATTEASTTTN